MTNLLSPISSQSFTNWASANFPLLNLLVWSDENLARLVKPAKQSQYIQHFPKLQIRADSKADLNFAKFAPEDGFCAEVTALWYGGVK
jgi:hypothetical protein